MGVDVGEAAKRIGRQVDENLTDLALGEWAQSIVTLQPIAASAAIASVNIIYKLHIFLGMTLFVVFPFTRLVHIISGFAAPVKYLLRNYQIVRSK